MDGHACALDADLFGGDRVPPHLSCWRREQPDGEVYYCVAWTHALTSVAQRGGQASLMDYRSGVCETALLPSLSAAAAHVASLSESQ